MGLLDDAKYIITGIQEEVGGKVEVEAEPVPDCDYCGGMGLATGFCPVCGSWDIRSDDEIADGDPDEEFPII